MKANTSPQLFAAIQLGSEQMGLKIVQYQTLENMTVLEQVFRAVPYGEEMFKTHKLSFNSLRDICHTLEGFKRIMAGYGVEHYVFHATTAVREAENRRYIVDQILVKTGLRLQVLDMPTEIFLKYCGIQSRIQKELKPAAEDVLLFVDIASGGLGFTLYVNGQIPYQQNLHIGVLRIKEGFSKNQRDSIHFQRAFDEYIYSMIEPVKDYISKQPIKHLIFTGSEMNDVLKMLGKDQRQSLPRIHPNEFHALYERIRNFNLPQLMQEYGFSESRAELLIPALLLYRQILGLANVKNVVAPMAGFIEGMVEYYVADRTGHAYMQVLEQQIVSLAKFVGRKYQYDASHSLAVADFSLILFDHLMKVHGLGVRERQFLKVAGILHDIGKYINLRNHHVYSYRLILSSDLFGFSEMEKNIIANIAYYHSRKTPSDEDENFRMLSDSKKNTLSKLAAIIRLADALDRSHRQKINHLEVQVRPEEMLILYDSLADTTLEEWTFLEKAHYFEEVFGIRAKLMRRER